MYRLIVYLKALLYPGISINSVPVGLRCGQVSALLQVSEWSFTNTRHLSRKEFTFRDCWRNHSHIQLFKARAPSGSPECSL
ncbi:hypothetical protein PFLUV_G00045680 [Perca fluviatilis]|uniref:Uncharacterized protein n=1 Tax=Perca fluviatilis TaxID=8168 RepID=A0A6A5FLH8_PERFL|nr:hypothetical protein PFLUV_G00045680 [Perca fluviatilis]